MTDNTELKRAASEAKNWGGEVGEGRWYTAECFKRPYFSIPDAEFIAACEPGAVLAVFAERDQSEQDYKDVVGTIELRDIEIAKLRAEAAGLRTGYEAYERVNAELKQKVANLEVCQTASLGMSGIIKCVAGELGFDTAGEDSAQDYLIGLARKASELKAENEALRESEQEATDLCDTLSALLGQIAVAVRGPEEPKSRHGFSDLPSRVKTVVSDCSKLKGESVALLKALDVAAARMVAAKACFDRDYPGKWSGELHLAVAIKEIEAALGQGEQS